MLQVCDEPNWADFQASTLKLFETRVPVLADLSVISDESDSVLLIISEDVSRLWRDDIDGLFDIVTSKLSFSGTFSGTFSERFYQRYCLCFGHICLPIVKSAGLGKKESGIFYDGLPLVDAKSDR